MKRNLNSTYKIKWLLCSKTLTTQNGYEREFENFKLLNCLIALFEPLARPTLQYNDFELFNIQTDTNIIGKFEICNLIGMTHINYEKE